MERGTKVRVINENGNPCAVGFYLGEGIPPHDLKMPHPTLRHFAIQVESEVRYYPTGFNTLIPDRA
jgi:hypothetical protein